MRTRQVAVGMPGKAKPKAKPKSRPKAPAKAMAKAKPAAKAKQSPSSGDWRAKAIDEIRRLTRAADPGAIEEVKWRKASNAMQGVPTWSHDGLLFTGETYKDKVKFTFARGAALEDPAGLFNAEDTGATRRAIDLREGESVDAGAFKALVQAAVEANTASKKR
ncbi:MAG: hypothetical protein QOC71_591 [Thermoplasmata archaeon]|nr:hypothetical protein [Thermoplasmata archaeon]